MYSRSSLYTGLKFCWADECVSVPPGKEGQEQGGLLNCAKGWQIEEEKGLMTRGEVLRVMTTLGGIDNLCFLRFGLASLGGAEVCNVFCHAYSLPYVQTYTYTNVHYSYSRTCKLT